MINNYGLFNKNNCHYWHQRDIHTALVMAFRQCFLLLLFLLCLRRCPLSYQFLVSNEILWYPAFTLFAGLLGGLDVLGFPDFTIFSTLSSCVLLIHPHSLRLHLDHFTISWTLYCYLIYSFLFHNVGV